MSSPFDATGQAAPPVFSYGVAPNAGHAGAVWTLAQRTLTGRRGTNQDTPIYCPLVEGQSALLAVADGMGGYEGGETASLFAGEMVAAFAGEVAANPSPEALRGLFPRIYRAAQQKIEEQAIAQPDLAQMGTTLASVGVVGNQFVVANIGDSRVYHIQGNAIQQLTLDHNRQTDALRRGEMLVAESPEEQRLARALTRVLRAHTPSMPEIFPVDAVAYTAAPGDVVLVVSDGLYGSVSETDMVAVIRHSPSAEAALQQLEQLAYERGSQDNITIMALAFGPWNAPGSYVAPIGVHSSRQKLLIAITGLCCIFMLLAAIIAWQMTNHVKPTPPRKTPIRQGGIAHPSGEQDPNIQKALQNGNQTLERLQPPVQKTETPPETESTPKPNKTRISPGHSTGATHGSSGSGSIHPGNTGGTPPPGTEQNTSGSTGTKPRR